MKKITTLLLILAMVFSGFGAGVPAAGAVEAGGQTTALTDIQGTKYETAVAELIEMDVISGYTDNTFQPEQQISRAEMAAIAVRIIDRSDFGELRDPSFADTEDHWAESMIVTAFNAGIIAGISADRFGPELPVTYAQAATMLLRALGHTDAALGGPWPGNYLEKAEDLGLTASLGAWSADAPATRGDVALMTAVKAQAIRDHWMEEGDTIEAVPIPAPAALPSMDAVRFKGPAVTVDLETVIEHRLSTGPAIELALINQRSDEAISRGYKEAFTNLQLYAPASLNAKLMELTRNFARENLVTNHEAELNSIRKDAVDLFYGAFSAQEYYRVAKEDLAVNELMLKNVQRRFDLGAASKLDLLTAQNALTGAKKALAEAQIGYAGALMNFNLEMGYPLQQEVVLQGDLTIPSLPKVSLDAAVASALEQRNEIKGALFAYEIQDVTFANAALTMNRLASSYKKQEVAYLTAKRTAETIHDQIRADVLLKYMGMAQQHMAALAAQSTAELAAEGYRIAQISYNAGMKTLAQLQEAEVAANQAKILAIGAVTDLTLALYDFDFATGVGTYRISL